MIGTATALLIGSLVSALAGAGAGVGTMIYNKNEAQRNRDFQQKMSNTAIQRQVADAQKAGISPSLILGGGGASQPMGATAYSNNELGQAMSNTANMMMNYIEKDRQMDFAEKLQHEQQEFQLETLEQKLRHQEIMSNTAKMKPSTQRNYTTKELNDIFTDLKNIKW